MNFHMFGLAHVPLRKEECICAYNSLAFNLARMICDHGHTLTIYAPAGSDAPCNEFVEVVGEDILRKAEIAGEFKFRTFEPGNSAAWVSMRERGLPELEKRFKPGDIILATYGVYHNFLLKISYVVVEPFCGYANTFSRYRVFPSLSWFHNRMALEQNSALNVQWTDAVIPHFVDVNEFEFTRDKDEYLLFLGRLTKEKGLDIASQVADLTGKTLIVAGRQDNGEEKLPTWAPIFRNVQYVGAVRGTKRLELLKKASCLIYPAKTLQTFGLTTIEALACGTPVVTSFFGGPAEVNVDGITGFHCRTLQGFLTAVNNIKDIDPTNCRKRVETAYSMDVAWARYERYFEEVLRSTTKFGWYSIDLEKYEKCIRWYPRSIDRGVVAGIFDRNTEWRIPWWFKNYEASGNTMPVAIADGGMSDTARTWCASKGTVIDLTDIPAAGCRLKPFVFLRSPYKRTLYLESDCKVVGNVSKLFEFPEKTIGMALIRDSLVESMAANYKKGFRGLDGNAVIYDNGIICADYADPTITEWATTILQLMTTDHESLMQLVGRNNAAVYIIPASEVSNEFYKIPGSIVQHRCCASGKDKMRNEMKEMNLNTQVF